MSQVLSPKTNPKIGLKNSDIPENYFPKETHYNQFLIGGELKKWTGAVAEVYSTIRTENNQGEMVPTLLGTVPDMESEPALQALESAKKLLIGVRGNGQPCVLRKD